LCNWLRKLKENKIVLILNIEISEYKSKVKNYFDKISCEKNWKDDYINNQIKCRIDYSLGTLIE
jgi:hypothetical protein